MLSGRTSDIYYSQILLLTQKITLSIIALAVRLRKRWSVIKVDDLERMNPTKKWCNVWKEVLISFFASISRSRLKLESASTSTLEDRVKRNIHSLQRTPAALEKNFMQRWNFFFCSRAGVQRTLIPQGERAPAQTPCSHRHSYQLPERCWDFCAAAHGVFWTFWPCECVCDERDLASEPLLENSWALVFYF